MIVNQHKVNKQPVSGLKSSMKSCLVKVKADWSIHFRLLPDWSTERLGTPAAPVARPEESLCGWWSGWAGPLFEAGEGCAASPERRTSSAGWFHPLSARAGVERSRNTSRSEKTFPTPPCPPGTWEPTERISESLRRVSVSPKRWERNVGRENDPGGTFRSGHMWPGFRGRERRLPELNLRGLLRFPAVERPVEGHISTGAGGGLRGARSRPEGQRLWVRRSPEPEDLHSGLSAGGAVRRLQRRRQEERGQLGQLHRGVRLRCLPGPEQLLRLRLPAGAAGEAHQEAPEELPGPERWGLPSKIHSEKYHLYPIPNSWLCMRAGIHTTTSVLVFSCLLYVYLQREKV